MRDIPDISLEALRKKEIIVPESYDIYLGDDGDIIFDIDTELIGDPAKPVLYYDGQKHAILVKNDNTAAVFDHINSSVRRNIEVAYLVSVIENPNRLDPESHEHYTYPSSVFWQTGVEDIAETLISESQRGEASPKNGSGL